MSSESTLIKQHVIDPEICIRCNTCEAICPVGAITHDSRNYVVKADVCNLCMACISPCPTGSIDNWRSMPLVRAYSIDEQLTWDELPAELSAEQLAEQGVSASDSPVAEAVPMTSADPAGEAAFNSAALAPPCPHGLLPTLSPTSMAPKAQRNPSPPQWWAMCA